MSYSWGCVSECLSRVSHIDVPYFNVLTRYNWARGNDRRVYTNKHHVSILRTRWRKQLYFRLNDLHALSDRNGKLRFAINYAPNVVGHGRVGPSIE